LSAIVVSTGWGDETFPNNLGCGRVRPSALPGTLFDMGILDRLMFWKDDPAGETDEYEVTGCFTLPDEPSTEVEPSAAECAGPDET
jgi:hypothetical protein